MRLHERRDLFAPGVRGHRFRRGGPPDLLFDADFRGSARTFFQIMTISFFFAAPIICLALNFCLYHLIRGVLEIFSGVK